MIAPIRLADSVSPFADFLPWADPYICSLIEQLRREDMARNARSQRSKNSPRRDNRLPRAAGNADE